MPLLAQKEAIRVQISAHVDYLALTFKEKPPNLPELFDERKELYETSSEDVRPLQGYSKAKALVSGALVLWGETRMGTHIICSGNVLQIARNADCKDKTLVVQALRQGARVTRIDLAIDLLGCRMTPETVKRAWQAGEIQTRATKARQWQQLDDAGHTVYIGAPTSDRIARVYDKNADLGLESDERWTRMELQNRGRWARATASALASSLETLTVAAGAFQKFMQWENQEYQAVLNRKKADIVPETPPEHDTIGWLIDQVAPAFARFEFEHPSVDLMAIFLQALADERLARKHQA